MDTDNLIIINGNEFRFESGETILETARRNQIDIPTLCHLKGTTPTGACRICVVEVERARSLLAACATPAAKNMVVRTESPKVVEARKVVLQLMLTSGNHNCAARCSDGRDWTDFQLNGWPEDTKSTGDLCPVPGATASLQDLAYRYPGDPARKFSETPTRLSHGDGQPIYRPGFFPVHQSVAAASRRVTRCRSTTPSASVIGGLAEQDRGGSEDQALAGFGLRVLRRMRPGRARWGPWWRKNARFRVPAMGSPEGAHHLQLLRCGVPDRASCPITGRCSR